MRYSVLPLKIPVSLHFVNGSSNDERHRWRAYQNNVVVILSHYDGDESRVEGKDISKARKATF